MNTEANEVVGDKTLKLQTTLPKGTENYPDASQPTRGENQYTILQYVILFIFEHLNNFQHIGNDCD